MFRHFLSLGTKSKTVLRCPTSAVNKAHFFNRSAQRNSSLFPQLPVLNASLNYALAQRNSYSLANTAVIYIHHALFTSLPILRAMFQLGLAPENTFVLGKSYSECKAVVAEAEAMGVHYQPCSTQVGLGKFKHSFTQDINWLWLRALLDLQNKKNINNLIVMDHGGEALAFTPPEILKKYKIVGIEKTTAGLINPLTRGSRNFPVVVPALCAAKSILESPLIAEAAVAKLLPLIPMKTKNITCGVLGYGAVGKAVADMLSARGYKVLVYDRNPEQLEKARNGVITTQNNSFVIANSDYLFGCSGEASIPSVEILEHCEKDKVCISVSSADTEFIEILKYIQQKKNNKAAFNPFANVFFENKKGAKIWVLRGGFPINFDKTGKSVPEGEIDLTRSLVFMSVLHVLRFLEDPAILTKSGDYMLDPVLQKFVATEWLKYQSDLRFPAEIKRIFEDVQLIAKHSGGIYEPTEFQGLARVTPN